MSERDFIIVLGDSQARTLAYHRNLLSFRVGGASFNHFLTPQRVAKTREKALYIVDRVSPENHFLMYYNGDVINHVEDNYGTWNDDSSQWEELLTRAATEYASLSGDIQKRIQGKVVVSLTLPNEERTRIAGTFYNQVLRKECEKLGLFIFDPWPSLAPAGLLLDEFRADACHVNHRITPFLIDFLKSHHLLPSNASGESDFGLRYDYSFTGEEEPISAWGDYPKDHLILDEGNVMPAKEYHPETKLALQCLAEIDCFASEFASHFPGKPRLMVMDCREGLLPLFANQERYGEIIGVDRSKERIAIAIELGRYASSKARFVQMKDYKSLASLGKSHIIVDVDRYEGRDAVRADLFRTVQSQCDVFFFLSIDSKRDKILLRKAGFKWCHRYPIRTRGEDDFDAVGLLAAFNFDPPETWIQAVEDVFVADAGLRIQRLQGKLTQFLLNEVLAESSSKSRLKKIISDFAKKNF